MGALTTQSARSLAALSETEIIQRIVAALSDACPIFPAGPGGDCAIFENQSDQKYRVSSIDSVILGRHFDLACSGAKAGRKLVERNLSDLAAAGATPSDALLSFIAGADVESDWLEDFAHGAGRAAAKVGLKIVGGDICRGTLGTFSATLAIQGHSSRVLTRRTCQAGDIIFVTGKLGGSIYGHHLDFTARLKEGQWLSGQTAVTACTDLSDGLAKDLPGLIGSRCNAHINLGAVPISDDAHALAKSDGKPALEHALQDGEDYELLFTASPTQADLVAATFQKNFPKTLLSEIGKIEAGKGEVLSLADNQPIKSGGFSHFG